MVGVEQKEDVVRMIPDDVIPVLQAAKVDFVLVGAHGASGFLLEPRSTQDVDFMLKKRDVARASAGVLKKFPELELEKHPDVWRYKRGKQYVLDLMLANIPLHKRVMKEFQEIRMGRRIVKVPKIESALAMKFAAMTGHYRIAEKKHSDASDFISMVKKADKMGKVVDLALLSELAELHYVGGGTEIRQYVADVRAGRTLQV